jgi:hypothetical protein
LGSSRQGSIRREHWRPSRSSDRGQACTSRERSRVEIRCARRGSEPRRRLAFFWGSCYGRRRSPRPVKTGKARNPMTCSSSHAFGVVSTNAPSQWVAPPGSANHSLAFCDLERPLPVAVAVTTALTFDNRLVSLPSRRIGADVAAEALTRVTHRSWGG